MDGKCIPQGSDLTERSYRRRNSSILKAPRSPLRDLGHGNELYQDSTLEKRRKSSRHVSFAETIRIFTPELQATGAADTENGDHGTNDSCNNDKDGKNSKCQITGMDTLLNGPIQVPGQQAEGEFTDCTKDKTIFFSSDDMDMTRSNTVAIDGLVDAKPKKINTGLFLASLKCQESEELTSNMDLPFSISGQKQTGFQFMKDTSLQTKIKFGDFLASLGNEKTKTPFLDGADKENIFPCVSKEIISDNKSMPTFSLTQENAGNGALVFREQEDGLDLTKCHTTNITSFIPMFKRELTNNFIPGSTCTDNASSQTEQLTVKAFNHLKQSGTTSKTHTSVLNDQTLLFKYDMDITRSHTTHIHDVLCQSTPANYAQPVDLYSSDNVFPTEKTIIFNDENEMELTKNKLILLNSSVNAGILPVQRNKNIFCMKHTTVFPEEDMDITKSHTVAIDGLTVDQMKSQASTYSSSKKVNSICEILAKDELSVNRVSRAGKARPNKSVNYIDDPGARNPQGNAYEISRKAEASRQDEVPAENLRLISTERTVVFTCDQDDMELTKSHTIAIDGKVFDDSNKTNMQDPIPKFKRSNFGGLRLSSVANKTLFFLTDSEDMELTRSHTVCIDQKSLEENKSDKSSGFQERETSVFVSGQREINADMNYVDQKGVQDLMHLAGINGNTSARQKCMFNSHNQGKHLSDCMVMTMVGIDSLKKNAAISAAESNNTLFTRNQEDMEITRSHSVAIDSEALCKGFLSNTCITNKKEPDFISVNPRCLTDLNIALKTKEQDGNGFAKTRAIKVDNRMPLSRPEFELPDIRMKTADEVPSGKSSGTLHGTLQDNTVFFPPDHSDMDITNLNTVAIKNLVLCGDLKKNITIPCIPFALQSDKTAVFEDDMELTKSHTMLIDGKNPVGLHNQATSVKMTFTTSGPNDMDITKSNTIFDNEANKMLKGQLHHAKGVSRRSCVPHDKSVYQVGDMEMSNVNVGILITDGKAQPWKKGTTLWESSKDETLCPCDQDDMDMTRANTVAIENKVLEEVERVCNPDLKSISPNNFMISSTAENESVLMNEQETIKTRTSLITFDHADMDIKNSKPVFIDNLPASEMPCRDRQLPIMSKGVPTKHLVGDLELENTNCLLFSKAQATEKTRIFTASQDKTLIFSCDQNDMDMTRSHTIAIESRLLGGMKDKLKDVLQINPVSATKNILRELENTMEHTKTQTIVVDRDNPVQLSSNFTSVKSTFSKDDTMEITRSNTVSVDHLSDKLPNKDVHVSLIHPKRKSASCQRKSFDTHDKTIRAICNMEETNTNFDLVVIEQEKLLHNSFLNRTVCNQGDMDITRSHTVAIESKSLAKVYINCPVESSAPEHKAVSSCDQVSTYNAADFVCGEMDLSRSHTTRIDSTHSKEAPFLVMTEESTCKDLYMSQASKDASVTFSETDGERELTRVLGKGIFTAENKDTHLHPNDESVFLSEKDTIDAKKAHTAAVGVNIIEEANYQGPNTSICARNGETEMVDTVKTSAILTETKQKCENVIEPMGKLVQPARKSIAHSTSMLTKTVMFLEDLGNMELTQIHAIPMEEIPASGRKTSYSGTERTCVFLEEDMDVTKSNTVFIDQKFKEVEHSMCKKDITRNTSNLGSPISSLRGIVSDLKTESAEENTVSDDESVIFDETGLNDRNFKCKVQPLDLGTENLTVGVNMACEPFDTNSQNPDACGLSCKLSDGCMDEKKVVADHVPSLQTEFCVPQKYPEALEDQQVSKKAKPTSKRVFFLCSEGDRMIRDGILESITAITMPHQDQFSSVPNQHPANSQVEPENIPAHIGSEISSKSDFTDQALIRSKFKNLKFKDFNNFLEKGPDILSNVNVPVDFAPLVELSQKDKNRRQSIADIQLKIKSLTHKSKTTSNHHTAPVSSLIEQLPTVSPTTCCPSINSIPKQVMLNEKMTIIEPIQGKENEPIEEKDATITKETCLPNRLSVKIFKPMLPNKRHSSRSNMQEPITSSVSEAQTDRASIALLKALTVNDSGQCIDEEMLPNFPDDPEINRLFQYEVPEGAWEELCEKEAQHKNLNQSNSEPKETMNGQKRDRGTEDDYEIQREKRARRNEDTSDEAKTSVAFKSPDKCYGSDYSSYASKTVAQTYCSSSSQDSRGDGMSVDLSSQQYSQLDSQLPWDSGCEQNLWQKFQDGTITVKEFFMLLRVRILIQKPRCSELPANRGTNEDITSADIMLDQFIYQPKLQVYEEECHTLYQTIEELKVCTELQEKPLMQISSLLWEAMRMCSENELFYFGIKLQNLKSTYSKKSKLLAHERKVSVYSKLLHAAQVQWEQLQARISETDKLLEELDDCISNLEMETATLDEECRNHNVTTIRTEIEGLKSQQKNSISESFQLEEQKQQVSTQIGCLQAEARSLGKHLQEPSVTEWELIKWTDKEATFVFLYDSLELTILFGDHANGEDFNNQPCRRISSVIWESQLDEQLAPASSILVHRLILQFIEKKGSFHETYKTQNDVPQLLFDVSLVVSRCRLLGEEVAYLIKWGAKYNLVQTQVQNKQVRLLFSSSTAFVKFELIVHLSETYPTLPLDFTVLSRIGNIAHSTVTAVMSKVPVGLWHLKRAVRCIHENLLV